MMQAKFKFFLTLAGSTVNLLNPIEYSLGWFCTFFNVFVIVEFVIVSFFVDTNIQTFYNTMQVFCKIFSKKIAPVSLRGSCQKLKQ